MNITVLTCKSESVVFRLYKLLALWLNNYTPKIIIDIYDHSSGLCERGNKLAKEYGIDKGIKFHCQDIFDIDVTGSKRKDIYICWKRKVTNCFALKVYLCAFSAGKQVHLVHYVLNMFRNNCFYIAPYTF